MPKCTVANIAFGWVGRRIIETDFRGEDLSRDGWAATDMTPLVRVWGVLLGEDGGDGCAEHAALGLVSADQCV